MFGLTVLLLTLRLSRAGKDIICLSLGTVEVPSLIFISEIGERCLVWSLRIRSAHLEVARESRVS